MFVIKRIESGAVLYAVTAVAGYGLYELVIGKAL